MRVNFWVNMELEPIRKGKHGAVLVLKETAADGKRSCPVLDDLKAIAVTRRAEIQGLYDLFDRFAEGGRNALTGEQLHLANKKHGIWGIRKGDTRAYGFFDGNNVIVVTGAMLKKGQKVDPKQVKTAVDLRKRLQSDREGRT